MSQQFREQLKSYKRRNRIETPNPSTRNRHRPEKFSNRDIEELMGINRPTFKRTKGGALKQK